MLPLLPPCSPCSPCSLGAPTAPLLQVLCWRDATFGRHSWQLPRCARPHPDATERCAVFAAALLEGKVLPSFAGETARGAPLLRSAHAPCWLLAACFVAVRCPAGLDCCQLSVLCLAASFLTAGLRQGLAVPPSMLLRPDMRVHKRVSELLAALGAARVDSRASLAAKWAQAPGFLRHELAQCMQKGCAGALLQAWEALQAEAAAGAAAAPAAK